MPDTMQYTGGRPSRSKLKLLGIILRSHREDRKLQQSELAEMTGISQGVLSKLERGEVRDIKLFAHLKPIADAYGITIDELLRYEDLRV